MQPDPVILHTHPAVSPREPNSLFGGQTAGGRPVSVGVIMPSRPGYATITLCLVCDGAVELRPVADQFHGDRAGRLRDPFGHLWQVGMNMENPTPEEIEARFATMMREDDR